MKFQTRNKLKAILNILITSVVRTYCKNSCFNLENKTFYFRLLIIGSQYTSFCSLKLSKINLR